MEYILEKKKHRNEIKLDFIGELHRKTIPNNLMSIVLILIPFKR